MSTSRRAYGINRLSKYAKTRRKNRPKPVFLARCLDCKSTFDVSKDGSTSSVLESKWIQVGEDIFFFKLFDCPYCKRRHVLEIDSVETKEMLDKLASAEDEQSARCKKQQKDLALTRKAIATKLDGVIYLDPDSRLYYNFELAKEKDCVVKIY